MGRVVSEAARLLMSASKQGGKGCSVWTDEERAALTARNLARTADQQARMSAKIVGELSPNAATSNSTATEIRALYASGVRQCELVVRFGLTSNVVNRIVHNKTYKVLADT